MFENVLVAINDLKLKTSKHKFKLNFMGITKCIKNEAANIPVVAFDFVAFPDILAGNFEGFLIG